MWQKYLKFSTAYNLYIFIHIRTYGSYVSTDLSKNTGDTPNRQFDHGEMMIMGLGFAGYFLFSEYV